MSTVAQLAVKRSARPHISLLLGCSEYRPTYRRNSGSGIPRFVVQQLQPTRLTRCAASGQTNGASTAPVPGKDLSKVEGASTDLAVIWDRFCKVALPYWTESEEANQAKLKLAAVVLLTIGTTGVSVLFNFLGRDFFNAISEKDVDKFYEMLVKWLIALSCGIPVFVGRDYLQNKLALEWREWLSKDLTRQYFEGKVFYQMQAGSLVDNPDQRLSSDVRNFTDTALGFFLAILNAGIDLVSFSGILYTIYPPLFAALLIYSIGGTAASIFLGQKLVELNFQQEAQEANFRYGLVRIRENAESIAFYGGKQSEQRILFQRLADVVSNFSELIITSRNLQFFTAFYRFLIQILPAAVVAPLFFRGEIEFGVINQSSSAFNHILQDVSLVVFQFEALAGFSAVVDRLGEFSETIQSCRADGRDADGSSGISLEELQPSGSNGVSPAALLEVEGVTLQTPDRTTTLVEDLSFAVRPHEPLLIMGPSGVGKTSLLRAVAGLWSSGRGAIRRYGRPVGSGSGGGDIFFLPQRPYVVLGTLREQLLYPAWTETPGAADGNGAVRDDGVAASTSGAAVPDDGRLADVLRRVRLGKVLERGEASEAVAGSGLDSLADWASVLSLGEQQRLAFARVLLAKPRLVLMDESTSAVDTETEAVLYGLLRDSGITYVSVGHRPTLKQFHDRLLRLQAGTSGVQWQLESIGDSTVLESVEV